MQDIETVDNKFFDEIKTVAIEVEDGFGKLHRLPLPPRQEWSETKDKIAHVEFR